MHARAFLGVLLTLLFAWTLPVWAYWDEDDDEPEARRLESSGGMNPAPRLRAIPSDNAVAESLTVKVGDGSVLATVWRYTLDGKTPRFSSARVNSSGIKFTTEGVFKLKVAGFHVGTRKRTTRVAQGTYSLRFPEFRGPVTNPPGGTIWKPTEVYSRRENGSKIHYTTDGSAPTESSPHFPQNGVITIEKTCTLKLRAFRADADTRMNPSAITTYHFQRENRVLLFLHGMNSEPAKWNDAVRSLSRSEIEEPAIIYGGTLASGESQHDRWGIYHYAVRFGSRDAASASARPGLENAASAIGEHGASGDFTTFAELGAEVADAINKLRDHYQRKNGGSTKVALVGHSRGGLAGRALLGYDPTSQASQAVVALLTLGTPHKGSALGRIYSYLQTNPRATDNPAVVNDWNVVDRMRLAIDVRTPTTSDLAIGSSENGALIRLNLPAHVRYGCAVFDGLDFGKMPIGFMYDIFAGLPGLIKPLSVRCQGWLMNGQSRSAFRGDGIVSASSQSLEGVVRTFIPYQNNSGVAHTNQTGQNDSIRALLQALLNWWN